MSTKVCVVAGVGPGIGKACCELYSSKGYHVVLMARQRDYLEEVAAALPNDSLSIAVDLTQEAAVKAAFAQVEQHFGGVDVLIYNAARGTFGGVLEIDPKELELNFSINTMGLLYCTRAVAPAMIERGSGSIMVTGNTAATRGGAKFAAFAPSKGAARSLTQSMARDLGPQQIHVSYLVIDAAIDGPFGRSIRPGESDDYFIQPAAIADAIWFLDQQPQNSWTFELDLRPHRENW